MYTKDETLLIDFQQSALYYTQSLYAEFSSSIKNIDRLKNEHSFQQKIQIYMDRLKQILERQALECISINRNMPTIDWFHKKLVHMIRRYMQDFLQWAETI